MGFGDDLLEGSASRFGDELLAGSGEPQETAAVPSEAYAEGGEFGAPVITGAESETSTPGVVEQVGGAIADVGEEAGAFFSYPLLQGKTGATDKLEAVGETVAATAKGAAATTLGLVQSGYDFMRVLGIDANDAGVQEAIKGINKDIEDYKTEYGVEGIHAGDVGRFLPTIGTLGLKTTSKVLVPLIEGIIAYGEQRGAGEDTATSSLVGLATTAGVAGFGIALDTMLAPTAKKVYDYVLREQNMAPELADDIFKNYQKIMKVEDTSANRVKAIIDSLGAEGASIKQIAKNKSPQAASEIRKEALARKNTMFDLAKAAKDLTGRSKGQIKQLENFASKHAAAEKVVRDDFTLMKANMPTTSIDNILVKDGVDVSQTVKTKIEPGKAEEFLSSTATEKVGQAKTSTTTLADGTQKISVSEANRHKLSIPVLEEVINTDRLYLKDLLSKETVTPKDLVDAIKLSKSLAYDTKSYIGTKGLNKLSDQLEGILKDNVSKSQYEAFKLNKARYSKMLALRDVTIGKTAREIKTGDITPARGLKIIREMSDDGPKAFKAVNKVLGHKGAADFEKVVINDALSQATGKGSGDFPSYSVLNEALQTKGFASKEGKAFQDIISTLDRSFASDDLVKAWNFVDKTDTASMLAGMTGRVKLFIVNKLWPSIRQRLPGKVAKHAAYTAKMTDILADPAVVKTAKEVLESLPDYEVQLIKAEAKKDLGEMIRNDSLKNVTSRVLGTAATE